MRKSKRESEWQVIRLRSKGEYLGTVTAADEAAALKAALKTFALDKAEADRLLVRRSSNLRSGLHSPAIQTKRHGTLSHIERVAAQTDLGITLVFRNRVAFMPHLIGFSAVG